MIVKGVYLYQSKVIIMSEEKDGDDLNDDDSQSTTNSAASSDDSGIEAIKGFAHNAMMERVKRALREQSSWRKV